MAYNVYMKILREFPLLLLLLCVASAVFGAAGDLDPAFGPVGFTTTNLTSGGDRAYAVARQDDGKIVAAGTQQIGQRIAIVRYNPDASLDSTFDGDGIVTIFTAGGFHEACFLARDSKQRQNRDCGRFWRFSIYSGVPQSKRLSRHII